MAKHRSHSVAFKLQVAQGDGAQLPNLISRSNTGSHVWADTAYRLQGPTSSTSWRAACARRSTARSRGVKPMPERTARANGAKSKVRSAVEHVFARQKGPMGLFVRTIGLTFAVAWFESDEPAAHYSSASSLVPLVAAPTPRSRRRNDASCRSAASVCQRSSTFDPAVFSRRVHRLDPGRRAPPLALPSG